MPRRLMIAFLISLLVTSVTGLSGCQTHITGVQQSVARTNETMAITAMKQIAVAQETYAVSSGGKYGTFLQLCEGGYLDERFKAEKPELKDYILTMEVSDKPGGEGFYRCNADPKGTGDLAGRHFYMDSTTAELKVNPTQPATAADPPYLP